MAERITAFRYTPQGASLGTLHYTSAVHSESLDGEDCLKATAFDDVRRNERIVWEDEAGWHEHMVGPTKRSHGAGKPTTEFSTYNSIAETWGWTADGTIMSGTVAEILAYLLKDTRWTSEGSDISGTYELETYHKQVRQCITELCNLCGGELQTHVEGASNGIRYRGASIVAQRGSRTVSRQFTYAHNMAGVSREENDSETVYTAVYCYGAPLEGQEGDYPERVTFAEINGGKPYLANDDMLEWWGCMGAEGEMHHTCTTYTDDACTDAAFLLAQGRKVLDNMSTPAVSYTADLSRIDQEGIQKVLIGDTIHVVDEEMGISFQKRVSYIAKRLDGTTSGKVVIGKRPNLLVEKFKAAETVSQKSTGNTSRVSSSTPAVRTNGYYGGSSRSGDSITHTLDGSPITGTVAFTTVGG